MKGLCMNFFKLLVATIVLASSFVCQAPPKPKPKEDADGWVTVPVRGDRRRAVAALPSFDLASVSVFPPLGSSDRDKDGLDGAWWRGPREDKK